MAGRDKIGQILVQAGLIDEFQLLSAISHQNQWGNRLGVTLVKLGFLTEPDLLRVLAHQLDLPVAKLDGKRIAPQVLELLPTDLAEKYRCIPLFVKDEAGRPSLFLGMENPTDLAVLDDLAFRIGMRIRPVLVGPCQLDAALDRYYHSMSERDEMGESGGQDFEMLLQPEDTTPLVRRAAPKAPAKRPAPPPRVREPVQPIGEEQFELSSPPGASVDLADSESERRSPAAKLRDLPTRTILHAITQLLIVKGVIARDELMEKLRAVSGSGEDREGEER